MKKAVLRITLLFALLILSTTAEANLITNGDFENGDSGWTTEGDVRIVTAGPLTTAAGMNGHYALLGLGTTADTSSLTQSFPLPDSKAILVSFDWFFAFWDNAQTVDDDLLSLLAFVNTTATTITMQELSSGTHLLGGLHGHFSNTYDIASFTGDNATVSFNLVEHSDLPLLTGTGSVAGFDNVVIKPVPEPATLQLVTAGWGIFLAGRKRYLRR